MPFSTHNLPIARPLFLLRLVRGALLGSLACLLLTAAASSTAAQNAAATRDDATPNAVDAPIVTKYQAITRQPARASSTQILQGIGVVLTICLSLLFVRTVRNEALAARQAELEGWAAPGQLARDEDEAELVGSSPAAFSAESETQHGGGADYDSASESLPEPQPEAAPAATGRVIYHVGPYHFSADQEVIGAITQNHLADLCDALCSADNERQVIRIASGLSCRYAKSQLAAQLAQMLADRHDVRVLALEGDLDAPALHRVMQVNVPRGYGLSEQLQRMAELETVDTASPMQLSPNLHVLAESRWSTPAALGLPQFSQLLSRQRDVYDFIVIDGPVVDTWPDAEHFGRLIDGVVFVTLASTRLPDTLTLVGQHFAHDLLLRIVKTGEPSGS